MTEKAEWYSDSGNHWPEEGNQFYFYMTKNPLIIHVKKIHQKEITTLIPEIDMEGSQTKVIKFMKKFQVRYNYFGSMRGHCLGKKNKEGKFDYTTLVISIGDFIFVK